MFDTIILLTGAAEHSVFTTVLHGQNPQLTVVPVFTAEDLAAIEPQWLWRARLICFATTVIVPPDVLDQLGYGGYKFHAGPPQYPGSAAAQCALADQAATFGGTVHRMIRRPDAGPIVDVEMFAMPEAVSVSGLEELTYTKLVQMFWRLAKNLATQGDPLIERAVRWAEKRDPQRGLPSPAMAGRPAPRTGAGQFSVVSTVHPYGTQLRVAAGEAESVQA
jgi:methionyl-tRNA formyltransferase